MIFVPHYEWSADGVRSVVKRYATPEQIARVAEVVVEPDYVLFPYFDATGSSDPRHLCQRTMYMLGELGIGTKNEQETADVYGFEVPLPAPGDCDDAGVCRCGCGLSPEVKP